MSAPDAPRVAVVTGAARGIGAATAHALRDDGWRVLAVDACLGDGHGVPGVAYALADHHDLERVADGRRVVGRTADVRDAAAMRDVMAHAVDRWGRLDAVVAAAAVVSGGRPAWETPRAEVDALWEICIGGVWNTLTAAVPPMLAGPDPAGCRLVAIASTASGRGLWHLPGYAVAKHAVVGVVRALAADLVGTGVSAVAVSPGATRTVMLEATAATYGVEVEELAEHQLSRRVHRPEEVAATVAYCCSAPGGLLNGSVVEVSGGWG